MVLYQTVKISIVDYTKTRILNLSTKETSIQFLSTDALIDDYNKKGFYLTAVYEDDFYLTKRVD